MKTCPERPTCDGCPLDELSPEQRLNALQDAVVGVYDAFEQAPPKRFHGAEADLGYRNRARMVFRPGHPQPLGFFAAGTKDVVAIQKCRVHAPAIERVLSQVRRLAGHQALAFVRHIDVRHGLDTLVTLDASREPDTVQAQDFAQELAKASPGVRVCFNVGGKGGILSGKTVPVLGEPACTMEVGGRRFSVPSTAFFQLNTAMLERMHTVMAGWMGDEVVIDAFCGVGVHGLALGRHAVWGMDVTPSAIEAARRNAAALGREGHFEVMSDASAAWDAPIEGATVILNPARAGVDPSFLTLLASRSPRQILYVSCQPLTFLRDAERLAGVGWKLEESHVFELMPRTQHVEIVARFVPGPVVVAPNAETSTTFAAVVEGDPPHGMLKGGQIRLRRMRKCGTGSVVRLELTTPMTPGEVGRGLRRAGYPVIGDAASGDKGVNQRWRRESFVDCAMIEPLGARGGAELSGFFVAISRVPRRAWDA